MMTRLGFAVIKYVQCSSYPPSGTICHPKKTLSGIGVSVLQDYMYHNIVFQEKKKGKHSPCIHSNARVVVE